MEKRRIFQHTEFTHRVFSEIQNLTSIYTVVGLEKTLKKVCYSLKDIFDADVVAFIPSPEIKDKLNLKPMIEPECAGERTDPSELFESIATNGMLSIENTLTVDDRIILRNKFVEKNQLKSFFAFSITAQGVTLACMLVGYHELNKAVARNSIEIEAARSLAAVACAKVYDQWQSQKDLTHSSQILREVLSCGQKPETEVSLFKLDAIMEYMLKLCNRQLGCQVANIWFYDKQIDRLVLARDVGSERDKMRDILKIGDGITGKAAERKGPVIVANVRREGKALGRLDWARAGSEIAVPILNITKDRRLLGVLNVEHREENALSKKNLPLLEKYAFLLALAIGNAEALNEYDTLVSNISVDENLDSILEQCWTIAKNAPELPDEAKHIISATLRLYNPNTKALVCEAYRGKHKPKQAYSVEELTSVNSWVFNKRKPIYLADVQDSWIKEHYPGIKYDPARKKTHSEYCVPLIWNEAPIGVINFESDIRDGFSFYTRRTIRAASFQVAAVIYLGYLQREYRGAVAGALLDYFSSGTIHEMMNMVRSIKGISQEIVDRLTKDPQTAAKKIESICNLVLAKADDQRSFESDAACDVHEILKSVIKSSKNWRQYIKTVKIEFDPFEDSVVYVDENKFWARTVFENILKNSFHALREREGKEPSWSASQSGRINVRTKMEQGRVTVYFEDNGIGLTPEQERKLFQVPFSDWLFSENISQGGHGNALLVMRHAIKGHGGDITVQRKDEGVQFIVTFRPMQK